MSTRSTGFALLSAGSVQEAHDFALISTAATIEARVSFLHIFDGFRTSHEVMKIDALDEDTMRAMIDADLLCTSCPGVDAGCARPACRGLPLCAGVFTRVATFPVHTIWRESVTIDAPTKITRPCPSFCRY